MHCERIAPRGKTSQIWGRKHILMLLLSSIVYIIHRLSIKRIVFYSHFILKCISNVQILIYFCFSSSLVNISSIQPSIQGKCFITLFSHSCRILFRLYSLFTDSLLPLDVCLSVFSTTQGLSFACVDVPCRSVCMEYCMYGGHTVAADGAAAGVRGGCTPPPQRPRKMLPDSSRTNV